MNKIKKGMQNYIRDFRKDYWITTCIFICMFLAYKIIADYKLINSFLFPPVETVLKVFSEHKDVMLLNMLYSFRLLLPSVAVAMIVALLFGTLLGMNKRLRKILYPVIYTISIIPSILLSPFVLAVAPSFFSASIFLVIYGTIWPTLFATITGIMTIDKRYLDNAATLQVTGWKKLFKIILPAASPSILSGFVNSLRGSFIILVYVEMYGTKYGMGYYVRKYGDYGLYHNTWAGFVFMVLVLVIVTQMFEKIKDHMLKWTIH